MSWAMSCSRSCSRRRPDGPYAWTGALVSGPVYAAFPVWLIVLSYRLPGHAGSPGQLV
ncbi:MAG TPA: hypothetical protein VGD83_25205 [Streptosporangiaceae bacterium]